MDSLDATLLSTYYTGTFDSILYIFFLSIILSLIKILIKSFENDMDLFKSNTNKNDLVL